MRHVLRNLLIGTVFLSVCVFVGSGSSQVFAASRGHDLTSAISHTLYPPSSYSHHSAHSHPHYNYGSYSQNYRQGYQDGYSDCQQQYPPANTYGQGQGYSDGYDAGYQFCQSKQTQGQIHGYQDGYNDGYAQCTREHQQHSLFSRQSPYNQGYGQGYQDGYQDGYNDCEASYGTGSSSSNHQSSNGMTGSSHKNH